MSASVIFVQLASLSNKAGHLLASTFVYIAAERPLYLTRQENNRHPLETQESPWRNLRTGLNIRYMIETKSKNPPSCSLCREKHFLPLLSSFPLLRGGKRVPSCSSNHLQLPAEILNQRFVSDLALVESLHFIFHREFLVMESRWRRLLFLYLLGPFQQHLPKKNCHVSNIFGKIM